MLKGELHEQKPTLLWKIYHRSRTFRSGGCLKADLGYMKGSSLSPSKAVLN